ncbi:cilia- and flagella-associated protein 61 [Austrofundulus limnaeus]|uniref:Cilia- and flagella-associated protein 61 n=1 Tax=Austrofundulus limnaeus TaxID=52670 RepID=A0A2I4C088_AUSLI|nr:PREDICTED: cilia- and flagella-associated protein 61 [Austrofundulus limnaeus]
MRRSGPGEDEEEEAVTVRRTESADAEEIQALLTSTDQALFGRIDVLHLLEKANLAVTVFNDQNQILAHASFCDYPAAELVDQGLWESFLHNHFSSDSCTPVNTLFLHLLVSQAGVSSSCAKLIIRTVFSAVAELDHICLLCPNVTALGPDLDQIFKPLQRLTDPGPPCSAFICHREDHAPRLRVRPARVEDHDDILLLLDPQNMKSTSETSKFILDLIKNQNQKQKRHSAVCEVDGAVVGFVSVHTDIDVGTLQNHFDLSEFDDFYKVDQQNLQPASQSCPEGPERNQNQFPSQEVTSNAFCIQLLRMKKKYETRSADCLPYLFQLFPDLVYCLSSCPEFPLSQNFVQVPSRSSSSLSTSFCVLHRSWIRKVEVRPAVPADRLAVSDLVKNLDRNQSLLQDLDSFYRTRSDPNSVPLQAFVTQVDGQVVGILIIRDEQDTEYLRARFNIENFIYFSHHRYDEHAHILHFILKCCFQNLSRHLFKEVLRLSHKSCLYHRVYLPHYQQTSCVHPLDPILDCGVPVGPRQQIIYPLEELGINAPSRRLTEDQEPFSLSLISRKLTMEQKVLVNSRVVVVGASDTGLAFLQVLCLCPHLRFTNLVLVSTHGFHGDYDPEDVGFLSTSHAHSSRDLAQTHLLSCVRVLTGKMVQIRRKSKSILLSTGDKVPYDHLILCTGLQYRVPCPTGVVGTQVPDLDPDCRYTGPVPSNLFTLNDPQDCRMVHHWICDNFVDRDENAVIFGHGVDVFSSVETLLRLGVGGSRIHVVQPPSEPGPSCFRDPAVERAVAAAMRSAGVQVHQNCVLAQINEGQRADPITSVSFSRDPEPVHLQCGVFINLSNKGVDHQVFDSISRSSLTFDFRLVIDSTFRTSDPFIYAAGPLTKFSCRYYSEGRSHADFSSKEVGQDLAAVLLAHYDPTLETLNEPEPDRLIPLYDRPKVQGAKLPGGFHYLHVTGPGGPDRSSPRAQPDGDIVTGRAETGDYFSLHLDHHELVETLTCLSLKPIPVPNYLSLYGQHQNLLGQLQNRYHQGLIPDLYRFFSQSSLLVVFHDRFPDFQKELNQISCSKPKVGSDPIIQEDGLRPQGSRKEAEVRGAVRSSAVRFLTYNQNLLPMLGPAGRF